MADGQDIEVADTPFADGRLFVIAASGKLAVRASAVGCSRQADLPDASAQADAADAAAAAAAVPKVGGRLEVAAAEPNAARGTLEPAVGEPAAGLPLTAGGEVGAETWAGRAVGRLGGGELAEDDEMVSCGHGV